MEKGKKEGRKYFLHRISDGELVAKIPVDAKHPYDKEVVYTRQAALSDKDTISRVLSRPCYTVVDGGAEEGSICASRPILLSPTDDDFFDTVISEMPRTGYVVVEVEENKDMVRFFGGEDEINNEEEN